MEKSTILRECPHCHRSISKKVASTYLWGGPDHVTHCNYCGGEVKPLNGYKLAFVSAMGGFWAIYLPTQFCLYYIKVKFWIAALIATLIWVIFCLIISHLTLTKIRFTIP